MIIDNVNVLSSIITIMSGITIIILLFDKLANAYIRLDNYFYTFWKPELRKINLPLSIRLSLSKSESDLFQKLLISHPGNTSVWVINDIEQYEIYCLESLSKKGIITFSKYDMGEPTDLYHDKDDRFYQVNFKFTKFYYEIIRPNINKNPFKIKMIVQHKFLKDFFDNFYWTRSIFMCLLMYLPIALIVTFIRIFFQYYYIDYEILGLNLLYYLISYFFIFVIYFYIKLKKWWKSDFTKSEDLL